MKVIFLDCDGILNNSCSKSRCGLWLGVDHDKLKRLKRIVEATDAALILSSSWKLGYNKDFEEIADCMEYLKKKLRKHQLHIMGTTPNLKGHGSLRGHEIQAWLEKNDDVVEEWIVLDDEVFGDYEECGIMPHLVKTEFYGINGGLQDEHVEKAIELLGRKDEEKSKAAKAD